MSGLPLSNIYGYGFFVKGKSMTSNPELFTGELNKWVKANEGATHRTDEFLDIKDEAEYRNRPICLSDLASYPEELLDIVYAYIVKNFPLLSVTAQILNKKGIGNKWLFCVDRSHIYLDFEKIKDAEKPTSEEKLQLEEFRTLLGCKSEIGWKNASYVDY